MCVYPWQVLSFNSAITPLMTLRAVYYREQAVRAYPSWAYSLSFGLIEIPYTIASTIPYTVLLYFMVRPLTL